MSRILLIALTCLQLALQIPAVAQTAVPWPSPEVEQMYKQAREFHSKGNLKHAITLYKQAIQAAPGIMLLHRELGQALYISGAYEEAQSTLEPVIANGAADEETYHIMASAMMARGDRKQAQKILKDALERYPHAGTLYHLEGKIHDANGKQEDALKSWLTGIENDPAYHINYYEAARSYMNSGSYVWAILYSEMFINIEQQTPRSHDTRKMLLETYKKLYASVTAAEVPKFGGRATGTPQNFEDAVHTTYMKLSPVVRDGFTAENLTMLRTRFIMDWYMMGYDKKYPFTLFSRHDDMLRNGYFDIYNQWLFGRAENEQVFEAWTRFHSEAIPELEEYLRDKVYRPAGADFYNDKNTGSLFRKKRKG